MTIAELRDLVTGTMHTGEALASRTLTGAYASDLLSDVMSRAGEGNLWITLVTHQNTIAVAALVGIPAILIIGGAQPADETVARAEQEQIAVMTSPLSAYEVCGRCYQAGLAVGGKVRA